MSAPQFPLFDEKLDLKIERIIELTPAQIYKAYTTPELLMKWFCPQPWKVSECEMDLRPGGLFYTKMESPEGNGFPTSGIFLELIPDRKVSWTDSMTPGYRPAEKSFMTAVMTFEPSGNGTKYTAIAKHKNAEDRKAHEDMGFVQGWNTAIDQLIAVMKTL